MGHPRWNHCLLHEFQNSKRHRPDFLHRRCRRSPRLASVGAAKVEVGHLSSWTLLSRLLQVSDEGASTLEQVSAQVWVQVWVQVVHFLLSCAIFSRALKVLAKPSLLSWVASINDSLEVLSTTVKIFYWLFHFGFPCLSSRGIGTKCGDVVHKGLSKDKS